MKGLLFYFDDKHRDYCSGSHDDIDLILNIGKCFEFNLFIMIDSSTSNIGERYQNKDASIQFCRYLDIDSALDNFDMTKVFISPKSCSPGQNVVGPISLEEFNYQKDAIYCFGSNIYTHHTKHEGLWVYLPCSTLFSHICIGIVGYASNRFTD